ncbi:MAG TPA: hypothetical protein VFV33_17390 [Gemmatimonadaceae bacterium]|nr:hypothetical protein [Gemmatimonadaceae bacterium]
MIDAAIGQPLLVRCRVPVRLSYVLVGGALLAAAPLRAQRATDTPRQAPSRATRSARTVQELATLRVGEKTSPLELPDSAVHGKPVPVRFFSHVDGCWGGPGETKVSRRGPIIELRAYDKRRLLAAGEQCPVQTSDAEHRVSLMITAPGTYTVFVLGRSDRQAKRDSADVRLERRVVVR